VIDPGACRGTDLATRNIGHVEYSTFTDAGNITFTLRIFQDPESIPMCEIGNGNVTLPVMARAAGTVNVMSSGPGCK
jgi:hypothetical protein